MTEFTTSAVGSMVITTCASLTASPGDAAGRASAPESAAVADDDRSQTVVRSPAATRLRAIAAPMMPVPSTATSKPWFCVPAICTTSVVLSRPLY
jgi:hypothetical protein